MADFGLGNIDFSKLIERPEFLSIALDKAGQSFDPNAPFAGVGTFLGQSSLANKAMQEKKQERQDWRNLIAQMVSGEVPVTPAGEPGISGLSLKPGKESGTSELSFNVTEPTDKKKNEKTIDLRDVIGDPGF